MAALGIAKLFEEIGRAVINSVDGAIKRVDTLQRFPKVMVALGYSAEQADAAIDRVSDSIEGLPTTLDDAVASVQRLTAATNDIELSTNLFAALNDMVLSNGASSEKASAAMEQLTQMISAQRVDMQA